MAAMRTDGPRAERMREALTAAFAPAELVVTDDSAKHAGHAGARPGGETHYSIRIASARFAGMSRVAMHRAVNEAVSGEFATGLHALSVNARMTGDESTI